MQNKNEKTEKTAPKTAPKTRIRTGTKSGGPVLQHGVRIRK